MKLALGISHISEQRIQWAKQLGVDHIKIDASDMLGPDACGPVSKQELQRVQEMAANHEVAIATVLLPIGLGTQYGNAVLGRPERDNEIEDVCETIRVIGDAGIPVVEYTWTVVTAWGRFSTKGGRGRATLVRFDYDRVRDAVAPPGEALSGEQMWDNLTYFLERVIPAAEAAGVRLACHPHDPPVPVLRGETRILSTLEGLNRLIELFPSDANGINFCQGTVTEMGVDVIEAIRRFGKLGKIHHVHFRNVRGTALIRYDEVFMDDGDVDMLEAMRAYHEVGYEYAIMPDHVPLLIGEDDDEVAWRPQCRAYAIGYMQALMKAVGADS